MKTAMRLVALTLALGASAAAVAGQRMIVGANDVIDDDLAFKALQAAGAQKGDLLMINDRIMPYFCDYQAQIVLEPVPETMMGMRYYVSCLYTGERREIVRTNP